MGKTADGAVWLDEEKLSNFDFYQFWRNIDDKNVSKFLHLFTKLDLSEIKKLSKLKNEEINEAKKILAFEVTRLARGQDQAKDAMDIANNVFDSKKLDNRINNIQVNVLDIENKKFTIIDAVQKLKLIESRSEIKRLIKSNGVKVNDKNYNNADFSLRDLINENKIKISIGKKRIGLINIISS